MPVAPIDTYIFIPGPSAEGGIGSDRHRRRRRRRIAIGIKVNFREEKAEISKFFAPAASIDTEGEYFHPH